MSVNGSERESGRSAINHSAEAIGQARLFLSLGGVDGNPFCDLVELKLCHAAITVCAACCKVDAVRREKV